MGLVFYVNPKTIFNPFSRLHIIPYIEQL